MHVAYGRTLHVGKRAWGAEVFVNFYNVYNHQGVAAVDNTYAGAYKLGTDMTDATRQNANPVSGGTLDDLLWVKTIDRVGVESSVPIGRSPNFGNTTARYSPLYAQLGARLTF